jgi:predicted ATP-grasp superfamily ATP-dependent carboligase
MPCEQVLIVGASTRAAAFSALRAGLSPWCLDLFADVDLQARCPVQRIEGRYPDSLPNLLATAPEAPWLYAGGLENHPALVDRLATLRPLWGNPGAVLRRVRDPGWLAGLWAALGVSCSADQTAFLAKPLAGAGGHGIRFHRPGDLFDPRREYLQPFLPGQSASALYAVWPTGYRLLGATWQLIGLDWLHAGPFRYCGNIGPVSALPGLDTLGEHLVTAGLRGLVGVDGILHRERFCPVEINPRYTAALEVLEYATGLRSLQWHRQACLGQCPDETIATGLQHDVVGKAILYAAVELTFPDSGPWLGTEQRPIEELPDFADLPRSGEVIPAGRPILTLLQRACTVEQCVEQLQQRARELTRWLNTAGGH